MLHDIKTMLAHMYPKRDPWTHKGDQGYVLVVAGSAVYSGSPVFNAMGALRAGADCVIVRGHPRAMNIAAAHTPDIITMPFQDEFTAQDAQEILRDISRYQALVLGCGLQRSEESFQTIRALIANCPTSMVLDAEALRALADHIDIVKGKRVIFTPNSEEFRVLTGETVGNDEDERKEKVKRWAHEFGVTILLKGHIDIVSDGDQVFVNKTGTTVMTKGGFGDVLTGIAGSLLARNANCFEVACVAAYINGKAGELAEKTYKEGTLASDTFEYIPVVVG